ATEPRCINPSLDERRCFCDLRSATIFAHLSCAIGVTGSFDASPRLASPRLVEIRIAR
ncbi:hypothetical protein WH47_00898, partial [Habropoda laboriosa]